MLAFLTPFLGPFAPILTFLTSKTGRYVGVGLLIIVGLYGFHEYSYKKGYEKHVQEQQQASKRAKADRLRIDKDTGNLSNSDLDKRLLDSAAD